MKKKIIFISTLFLLTISLLFAGIATVRYEDSGDSSNINVSNSSKQEALIISGNINLEVGEELDFSDKFNLYVKQSERLTLNYEVENEEVIYLTKNKCKLIALRAGTSKVIISSDKYYTELNIIVELYNYCEEGTIETLGSGTRWEASNEEHFGWRLYTGGASVASDQIVEVLDDNGNNVVHIKHTATTQYSNLYKSFTVEPGQYYVTAKMKGEGVLKDTYVRVNQGNKYGLTQTQKIKGTFEWAEYKSEVVRVAEGEKLKLELYFALNEGEVWFDDLCIYRVITTDYTTFTVNNSVEKLEVGGTVQIECETYPESIVDYQYYYESADSSIATVDVLGNITAVKNGITTIKVKDSLYDYVKEVMVIVGVENGINATINNGQIVEVPEDATIALDVNTSDSSNFVVAKYSEPVYGNYYISNNKVIYTPKADFYSLNDTFDTFKVIAFDSNKGYKLIEVTVNIKGVDDLCSTIEFWHTTDKNTDLKWVSETTKAKYSSVDLYNGGYLQVECEDIEALYPQFYKKNMSNAELAAKTELYKKVRATSTDNKLEITTNNGGKVTILLDGVVQEIHDRYYDSQGKIIYGVLYDYSPAKDFYGYDFFDLKIINGKEELIVKNTIYVAPGIEEFKFEELNFDGVYLLTNNKWLKEVQDAYKKDDQYIKTWVEYYESQYVRHVPAGVPADARTPMEQLAILYKVTGNKKYLEACWSEIEPVVKDEAYSQQFLGNETRRLSWGQDSNGFLDAAMVTYSVAFAYNFIKDDLTAAQKEIVMKALYEEGFYYFKNLTNVNVLLHGNNHNLLVCGDLAVAALSAMSYEGEIQVSTRDHGEYTINVQEMAAETVATAFKYLQIGLVHYAENGGFPEGPSYSIYAHRNMVSLLSTLDNLYGRDANGIINSFGLSSIEGIMNYVNYPLYSSSPNYESFFYAESEYSNNQPALLWYTRLDESNYNAALLSKLAHDNEQYNIQSLLYYKPGLFERVDASKIQKLDYLLDEHELATFRSAFGNEMAIFTGLKGTNSDSGAFAHKNLDSGTFELYALGERFIGNYSNETYNVVVPDGYWDYDYQRWTYYKKSAQGQNTLVFNPDKNPVIQQDPYEKAPIIRFESNETSGLSVIDLSKVYKSDAISVYRGLKLFDNRSTVLVQDEFKLRDYSTLYWSAHTEARIDIINEKLARLTLNGKSIYAIINSELGAFTKMSANSPLPGTQGDFCNLDNDGVNKLIIKLDNIVEGTLSVVFVSSLEEIKEFKTYNVTPIANWTLDNTENAISDISVENITFDAELGKGYKYVFNPNQYEYVVRLSNTVNKVPELLVTFDKSKYKVAIEETSLFNQVTKVIVKDKESGKQVVYKYKFIVDVKISDYENYAIAGIVNVSGHENAINLIDGEKSTTISSTNKEEIIFELSKKTKISDVLIRFSGGIINTYYFDIYTSLDGENYQCVYFAGQNSNGMGDEVYSLGSVKAKYVKIVFNGEIRNDKITVADVQFLTNEEAVKGCSGSMAGSLIALLALSGAVVLFKKRKEE